MADVVSIALSGMNAQSQRLSASANNIANMTTTGRLPTSQNPDSTVYKPLSVSYSPLLSGGVIAQVTENANGYSAAYMPTSPYANAEGLIAAPNVDLATETVNIMTTKAAYKANLSVLRTYQDMMGDLMDTLT